MFHIYSMFYIAHVSFFLHYSMANSNTKFQNSFTLFLKCAHQTFQRQKQPPPQLHWNKWIYKTTH